MKRRMRPARTRRMSRTDRRLGPSSSSAVSLEADEGFSVDDLGESC